MLTIFVSLNLGICVREYLFSYILMYAMEVGRLHQLCLKCSSVRPQGLANWPEEEIVWLREDADLIFDNMGKVSHVHSSMRCYIIESGVELCPFKPIGMKGVLHIHSCGLSATEKFQSFSRKSQRLKWWWWNRPISWFAICIPVFQARKYRT